jgi:hypothetical protein
MWHDDIWNQPYMKIRNKKARCQARKIYFENNVVPKERKPIGFRKPQENLGFFLKEKHKQRILCWDLNGTHLLVLMNRPLNPF